MAEKLKYLFTNKILPKLSLTKQDSFHNEFTSIEWENLTESDFFTRTKNALGVPLHLVNSTRKEEEKIDVYEYCYFESNEWQHCDCQEIFKVVEVIVLLKHQKLYYHFDTFTEKCTPDIKTIRFLSSQMSNFVEIGIDLLMKIDQTIDRKVFMCDQLYNISENSFGETLFSVLNKKGKYDQIDFLFKTDCVVPQLAEVHNITRVKERIRSRNLFHEHIKKGDMEAIDDYLKKNPNLKYCNNKKCQSACAKAIRMNDFDLYSYLHSRGLTVRHYEANLLKSDKFLMYFRNKTLPFEQYSDQYLRILKSKTLTRNQTETDVSVEKVYEELRLVDGFEKVIKILCKCQDVLLVLDYHENDITRICPYGTGTMKGLFDPALNRLFISGGEGFKQMLGTAAHEMTHFVMQLVYDNNARPYSKNDAERRNKFDEIVYEIISEIQSSSNFENIITRAYNSPEQYHAELIVRVNHVLAYYGNDEGRRILLAQAPKLLEYYENYIIPDLDKYLRSHYNRNNNTFITPFNQKIENLHVHFDKPNDPLAVSIEEIWRNPKEIANSKNLIIKTESVQLTCLKIFQNIIKIGSSFNLDNTYIVDSETYFANQQQVKFYFQNYELLVIADTSSKRTIQEWEEIANYVNDDIFKQFIFVLDKDRIWTSQEGTDEIEDSFEFNDFNENSRVFIIEKLKVNFQGQDVELNQLANFIISPENRRSNNDTLKNDNFLSYDMQLTSQLLRVNDEVTMNFPRHDIKFPELVDLRQKPDKINKKCSSENLESFTLNIIPIEDKFQVNESSKQSTQLYFELIEPIEKFDLFNSMFSAQIVSDYLFNDVQVIVGTELSSLPSYIERFFEQKGYTFEQLYYILKGGKIKFFNPNKSKDLWISLKDGQTFYLPDRKSILSSVSDEFLNSMFSSKYGSSDDIFESTRKQKLLKSKIFVFTLENGESLMVIEKEIFLHLNNVSDTYLEKLYESNNKYFDIYWFEKFDGNFFWRNTFGDENADIFINVNFEIRNINYSEYGLFDKLYYQKIILIAATAGMGKSSTLKNVARQMVKKNPTIWAPLIILKNRTEIFKKFTDNSSDPDYYLNFLLELLQLKTNFERVLFKFYCTNTDKVYLFLDGVDEISPLYTDTLMKLINELSKTKIKHIILTIRVNLRSEFERQLNTSSISIKSFSSNNQIQCMKNNWKSTDIQNMDKIASTIITLFKKKVPSNYEDVINIPLQIFMLAKLCENQIYSFSKDLQEMDRFFKEFTIYKMYEKFIEQKLDITFQEKAEFNPENLVVIKYSKDLKKNLILQFTNASVVTLLSEKESVYFLSQEEIKETETFIDGIENWESYEGIIDGVFTAGKPNFVHRTYAEYFFAFFLIKLRSWTDPAKTFFFEKILVDSRFAVVRQFLNSHIKNFYILTYIKSKYNGQNFVAAATNLAVYEGNLNILQYLHKTNYKLSEIKSSDKHFLLQNAVKRNHSHIAKFLLSLWTTSKLDLEDCEHALNDAIDRNDIEFIKLLLTRCKPVQFDTADSDDLSFHNRPSSVSEEDLNRSVELWNQAETMLLEDYDLDELLKIVKELASPASLESIFA